MNKLPFDIIELINEKTHKLNTREFLIPEFNNISNKYRFRAEVFPELLETSSLFTIIMCNDCIYHGGVCINCAQYDDAFKYGPGFVYGKRVCINDGSLTHDEIDNLIEWKNKTGNDLNVLTMDEFNAYIKLPQFYFV